MSSTDAKHQLHFLRGLLLGPITDNYQQQLSIVKTLVITGAMVGIATMFFFVVRRRFSSSSSLLRSTPKSDNVATGYSTTTNSKLKNYQRFKFVPYYELNKTPNVIVDGSSTSRTTCRLVVYRYLKQRKNYPKPDDDEIDIIMPASNNHFDLDGLAGLYALIYPEEALKREAIVVDSARAGDFVRYEDERAAKISFTVDAFAEPETSPLDESIFSQPYPRMAASLYEEMLKRFPDIVDNIDKYESYWKTEFNKLKATEAAIERGDITIRDIPDVDITVVTIVPVDFDYHLMPIHNRTNCYRTITIQGSRYKLTQRYESWVEYQTKGPHNRLSFDSVAATLTELEKGKAVWKADSVSSLTACLSCDTTSSLSPEQFIDIVTSYCRSSQTS